MRNTSTNDSTRLWAIGIGAALIASFFVSWSESHSLYELATSKLARLLNVKTWVLWMVLLSGAALLASALSGRATRGVALFSGIAAIAVTIYVTGIAFFLVANWGGVLFITLAVAALAAALLHAKPKTLGFIGGAMAVAFFLPWVRSSVHASFFSNGETGFTIARHASFPLWVDICVWMAPLLGAATLLSSAGDDKERTTRWLGASAGAAVIAPVLWFPIKGFYSHASYGAWIILAAGLGALAIAAVSSARPTSRVG